MGDRAQPQRDGRPAWALVIPWPTSSVGGVSQVVLNLAEGLQKHGGYKALILVQDWSATRPRVEVRNEILHVRVRLRAGLGPGASRRARLSHLALGWWERRVVGRLLRAHGVTVVNFHYPTFAAEPFVLGRGIGKHGAVRTIFSLHGLDVMGLANRPADERTRYARMLACGHAVVAVSAGFRDDAVRLMPELEGRISVIHNGVDAVRLRRHGVPGTRLGRYILNVATFEVKKGQIHLLNAFAGIAAHDPGLHLVMAGKTAGELEPLRAAAAGLGLSDRVLMLQDVPHDQVGALYAEAAVFCLSSLAEPFGIVLLEAGIHGLPVVATRVGGVPEVVRDGEHGLLVPAADAPSLATALRRLLDDAGLAQRLAGNLRARVLQEFTWPGAVQRYVTLASA